MYYYIRGKLSALTTDYAVIDCGGVGYLIFISGMTYEYIAENFIKDASGNFSDSDCLLYTFYKVGEDCAELYGFCSKDECAVFKLLISVSGVGPKAAISILSNFSPSEIALACACGDAKELSRANGIGIKTAQKIIIELKDKIAKLPLGSDIPEASGENRSERVISGETLNEAVNALVVLGYTKAEAAKAVKAVSGNHGIEDTIRLALQKLVK